MRLDRPSAPLRLDCGHWVDDECETCTAHERDCSFHGRGMCACPTVCFACCPECNGDSNGDTDS